MQRVNINGVEIYPFSSREQLLGYIDGRSALLVAVNAEKLMRATSLTRSIINSNIGYCDGSGVVMALRQRGVDNACKIPGCELWLDIVARYHATRSFYLVGSRREVIEETVARLKHTYPGINIVGYRDGYLNGEEDRRKLIEQIATLKPDIVFVAMGSPKQELLMSEMLKHHSALYQGLGGSFDVYTGHAQRAPKWWLDHNLEFAYRFLTNPRRFKRQLPILKLAVKLLFHRV